MTCTVTQRQRIVLGVGWNLVKWHLEGMYGSVEEGLDKDGVPAMRVSFKTRSVDQGNVQTDIFC